MTEASTSSSSVKDYILGFQPWLDGTIYKASWERVCNNKRASRVSELSYTRSSHVYAPRDCLVTVKTPHVPPMWPHIYLTIHVKQILGRIFVTLRSNNNKIIAPIGGGPGHQVGQVGSVIGHGVQYFTALSNRKVGVCLLSCLPWINWNLEGSQRSYARARAKLGPTIIALLVNINFSWSQPPGTLVCHGSVEFRRVLRGLVQVQSGFVRAKFYSTIAIALLVTLKSSWSQGTLVCLGSVEFWRILRGLVGPK